MERETGKLIGSFVAEVKENGWAERTDNSWDKGVLWSAVGLPVIEK